MKFCAMFAFFCLANAFGKQPCPSSPYNYNYDNTSNYCYYISESSFCEYSDNLPVWNYIYKENMNGKYFLISSSFENNQYLIKEKGIYYESAIANVEQQSTCPCSYGAIKNVSCHYASWNKNCHLVASNDEMTRPCFYDRENNFCSAYNEICGCKVPSCACVCFSDYGKQSFCRWNCNSRKMYKYKTHNCDLCEEKFQKYGEPAIELYIKDHKLYARVTNFLKLKLLDKKEVLYLTCFGDTVYSAFVIQELNVTKTPLKYVRNEKEREILYEIIPATAKVHTPGKYWCKGFAYPDLEIIESNIVEYEDLFDYVLTVNIYLPKTQLINLEEALYKTAFEETLFEDIIVRPISLLEAFTVKVKIFGEYNSVIDNLEYAVQYFEDTIQNKDSPVYNQEFCSALTYVYNSTINLTWNRTYVGNVAENNEKCLDEYYNILTLTCCLNGDGNAEWSALLQNCVYILDGNDKTVVSEHLDNLLNSNLTAKELSEKMLDVLKTFHAEFGSFDVHLVGKLINKLSETDGFYDMQVLVNSVSQIMDIKRDVLKTAQTTRKATDSILRNLDKALSLYGKKFVRNEVKALAKNLNVHVVNLTEKDVSTVAFYEDGTIKVLENGLGKKDFSFAVVLTEGLHQQLLNNTDNTSVFSLIGFKHDSLFNWNTNQTIKITGWIPNVFVPDLNTDNLTSPIHIIIKPFRNYRYEHSCSYWEFESSNTSRGYWAEDNVPKKENGYFICSYNHMTNFALVLNLPSDIGLDIVSVIGYTLSIIGVALIYVTALLSRSWRETESAKICLSSSATIIIQVAFLYLSSTVDSYEEPTLCVTVGAFLQYGILAQFSWMLIMGILQYRKFIIVFTKNTQNLFILSSIFCWLTPVIPVATTVLFSYESYIRDQYCYLTGLGLYLGVFLPVALVVTVNILVFIRIFHELCAKQPNRIKNSAKENMLYIKLSIFLFFVLGLSWVFGLLNGFLATPVFSYLFCMLTAIQGFVLFWYHIILNAEARYAWKKVIARLTMSQDGSNLISDKNSTNTTLRH